MAIYTYSDGSLIDEVEIITNAQGGVRAYLHARNDITKEQISALQEQFFNNQWIGIPCSQRGKPLLELRGFKKPEELAQFLQVNGWVRTAPDVVNSKNDKIGFWDKFKQETLKFSGWSYIVGDTAFMTYAGMEYAKHRSTMKKARNLVGTAEEVEKAVNQAKDNIRGGRFKILSGLGYAAGSLILAGYGSHDQSHLEIKKSVQKIDRFIKTEGLCDVDNESVLRQEPDHKNRNFFEFMHDTLRRYPSEALNFIYTGVGLALMRSSFKQISTLSADLKTAQSALSKAQGAGRTGESLVEFTDAVSSIKKNRRGEIIDVGLGAITASSSLAGILIKEKKPLEGQKKRDGLLGVWDWIQEQPLRVTGYGLMLATMFHGWATFEKWQPNKQEMKALAGVAAGSESSAEIIKEFNFRRKTLIGRGVFIAANVIAEALMVLSSKGHGEGVRNPDVDESVIASTAEFIAKQNPATQESLIQRLAGYMSAPDVLGIKAETLAADLRAQVASMASNPWAQSNPFSAACTPPSVAAEVANVPATKIHASSVVGLNKSAEKLSQTWKDHVADSKQELSPQVG